MDTSKESRKAIKNHLSCEHDLLGLGGGFGDSLVELVLQARRTWGVADLEGLRILRKLTVEQLLEAYEASILPDRVPHLVSTKAVQP